MPIAQRLAGRPQTIGAGLRQPIETCQILAIEPDAVADQFHPMLIVEAAAVAPVEQLARNVGRIEQAGFLILDLVHAAAPAPIAQGFPLAAVERRQRLFPKTFVRVHDKATHALLTECDQAGFLRAKSMNYFRIAIVGLSLAAVAAPVLAQTGGFDGIQFVDSVRKKDGTKVMEAIRKNGPGIVNAKDVRGDTALIVAITDRSEEFTAYLLNQGADPNLGGKGGDSPLIAAARVGYLDAAQWLLGQGAKIDGINRMGETALIIAVQQRQVAMVRVLLAAGANPDRPDSAAGLSAREYAARDGRSRDIIQAIEAKKPKAATAAAH